MDKEREFAEQRPQMVLGGEPSHAHRMTVSQAIRLSRQSYAFKNPKSVSVTLSPRQYIVRSCSRPLKDEVAGHFTWSKSGRFFDTWDNQAIVKERDRRIKQGKGRGRSWINALGSPVGPNLTSPLTSLVLATRYFFGIKTKEGIWCQSFHENVPVSDPVLILKRSKFGFVVAAELDANWFTGLPFTEKDVETLSRTPGIAVEWRNQDDLLDKDKFGASHYRSWFD